MWTAAQRKMGSPRRGRGRQRTCLRSRCPTYTTPSLIGFPTPFVWKENTHPRCHAHSWKTCRATCTPLEPVHSSLSWFTLKLLSVSAVRLFPPHFSQIVVCSGLPGRALWQNQFCWPRACSMFLQLTPGLFLRQHGGKCLQIRFRA